MGFNGVDPPLVGVIEQKTQGKPLGMVIAYIDAILQSDKRTFGWYEGILRHPVHKETIRYTSKDM